MNRTFFAVYHPPTNHFYNFNLDPLYIERYGPSLIDHLSTSEAHARQIYEYGPNDRTFFKVEMTQQS